MGDIITVMVVGITGCAIGCWFGFYAGLEKGYEQGWIAAFKRFAER